MSNKRAEAMKALTCLYLAVEASVADDVKETVVAALDSFPGARATMSIAFRNDVGLWRGYRDNLAMLVHDRWGITDKSDRDRCAAEIMKLIFEVEHKEESA